MSKVFSNSKGSGYKYWRLEPAKQLGEECGTQNGVRTEADFEILRYLIGVR